MFSKAQAGSFSRAKRRILLFLVVGVSVAAEAQRVESLAQAKTLYVAPFGGGVGAGRLQQSLVRHLAKSRFKLVQSPKDADAIVRGDGQVWIRGYIAMNPRTPGRDRETVYGGYFSLEVVGADGQPLWSWFATPSKHIFDPVR